jgi:hypothetical protein
VAKNVKLFVHITSYSHVSSSSCSGSSSSSMQNYTMHDIGGCMQARNTCMQSLMHVTDSMRSAIGYIAAGFAVKQSMPCACANIHSQITSCVVAMITLQCCASMLVCMLYVCTISNLLWRHATIGYSACCATLHEPLLSLQHVRVKSVCCFATTTTALLVPG